MFQLRLLVSHTTTTKEMKVLPLFHCIHLGTLDLVKFCITSSSLTKKNYCEMSLLSNSNYITKTLWGRATSVASNNDLDLMKYVFCDNYSTSVKGNFVNNARLNVVRMVLSIVYGLLFLMQI